MKVTFRGVEYELTDEEQDALAAFGPDVADGSMTEDEAVECVLVPREDNGRASRAEQHARYLDCGPQAWDDR